MQTIRKRALTIRIVSILARSADDQQIRLDWIAQADNQTSRQAITAVDLLEGVCRLDENYNLSGIT